jgi:hypothetical protein
VVVFADFPYIPIRSKTIAGNIDNFHNNTVAYDYPDESNNRAIHAWDSPFDFIYKMHAQRRAIRDQFQQYFISQSAYGELINPADPNAVFPTGLGEGNITQPNNSQTSKRYLARKDITTATYYQWKFYWKEPAPDTTRAYIPGLGFLYHDVGQYEDGTTPGVHLGFTNNASAGVDCVGFAQRAASYQGNLYSWTNPGDSGGIPSDRAEGNVDPDDVSRINRTAHPTQDNGYSIAIVTREEMPGLDNLNNNTYFITNKGGDGAPTIDMFDNQIRLQFLKIVPGDVIGYSGHVGIVCKVDTEAMLRATSIYDLMRAVIVIESVYNGRLNHVFMRNMLQGAGETFNDNQNNGTKSWHINLGAAAGSFRDWYIGRLNNEN